MKYEIVAVAIVIAAAILSTSFFVAPVLETSKTVTQTLTVTTSNTLSWKVVRPNVTVRGLAAGIPCGSLRLPCATFPNQSIQAELIEYNGTYYYLSYFGLTQGTINPAQRVTTWYMVWYDNSTYYCVSPPPRWAIACPLTT